MTLEATNTSSTNDHPFIQSEAKGIQNQGKSAVQTKSKAAARFTQSGAKSAARCRHFTADGTRCRLPILDTRAHLCFRHASLSAAAAQPQHNDAEDLSADLLPELAEFSSGLDIQTLLARLFTLVAKGRISPRRASVLAYITNQILHSHRAITLESAPAKEQPRRIIIDMPEPNWPEPEPKPENPTYADLRS